MACCYFTFCVDPHGRSQDSPVLGMPDKFCISSCTSLTMTSAGMSGTTRVNNTAAPTACDAAIRVLVRDMVMKCFSQITVLDFDVEGCDPDRFGL